MTLFLSFTRGDALSTMRVRRPTPPEAFVEGFATPFQGFAYMTRHSGLWRYAIIPIVLNLLITIAVVALTLWAAVALYGHYEPQMPEGVWDGVVRLAAIVLLVIACGGLAVVSWMFLNGVLCGHFYGRLARRWRCNSGFPRATCGSYPSRIKRLTSCARSALAIINVACLLLNLVPVIGSMTAPFVAFYYDSLIFGIEYLDFPLALRAGGAKRSGHSPSGIAGTPWVGIRGTAVQLCAHSGIGDAFVCSDGSGAATSAVTGAGSTLTVTGRSSALSIRSTQNAKVDFCVRCAKHRHPVAKHLAVILSSFRCGKDGFQ